MSKVWLIRHGENPLKKNRDVRGRFATGNTFGSTKKSDLPQVFKEGHTPWNHKTNGAESLRKKGDKHYWYIKVDGKWIIKHRWLWETTYGKPNPKLILAFKNGNTSDCRIENLELINRSECLKRHRDPDKIKKGKRTRMLLIKCGIIQPKKKKR